MRFLDRIVFVVLIGVTVFISGGHGYAGCAPRCHQQDREDGRSLQPRGELLWAGHHLQGNTLRFRTEISHWSGTLAKQNLQSNFKTRQVYNQFSDQSVAKSGDA